MFYPVFLAVDWETQIAIKQDVVDNPNQFLLAKKGIYVSANIHAVEPDGIIEKQDPQKNATQRIQFECLFLRCKQPHGSITIMLSERPCRSDLYQYCRLLPTYEVNPPLHPDLDKTSAAKNASPVVRDGVRYVRVGSRYRGPLCAGAGYVAATEDPETGRVTQTKHCKTITLITWDSPNHPDNHADFAPLSKMEGQIGFTLARFFQQLDIDHPTVTALDLSGTRSSISSFDIYKRPAFFSGQNIGKDVQMTITVTTVCWALGQGHCRNLRTLILSPYATDLGAHDKSWRACEMGYAYYSFNAFAYKLGKSALWMLGQALGSNDCRIRTLSLSGCRLNNARHLFIGLAHNRSIMHLCLARCQLTDKSLKQLAEALESKRNLLSLDISKNSSITRQGLNALADTLGSNSCLQSLDLRSIPVDNRTMETIVTAVDRNKTILEVLCPRGMPKKQVAHIKRSLKRNESFQLTQRVWGRAICYPTRRLAASVRVLTCGNRAQCVGLYRLQEERLYSNEHGSIIYFENQMKQWCLRDALYKGQVYPAYHVPNAADNLRCHPPLESACWVPRDPFEPWGFIKLPRGNFFVNKFVPPHTKLRFVFPDGPVHGATFLRLDIHDRRYMVRAGLLLDTGVHKARLYYDPSEGAKTDGMLDDRRPRGLYGGMWEEYHSASHITLVCPPGATVHGVVTQALDSRQHTFEDAPVGTKIKQKWSFTVYVSRHGPNDEGEGELPTFAPLEQEQHKAEQEAQPDDVKAASALLDFFRWLPGLRKQIGAMMIRYYNPMIAASFGETRTKPPVASGAGQLDKGPARHKRSRKRNKKKKKETLPPSPADAADAVKLTHNPNAQNPNAADTKDGKVDDTSGSGAKPDPAKTLRKLQKKLRQIERLVEIQTAGGAISAQQQAKIDTAGDVRAAIADLSSSEA